MSIQVILYKLISLFFYSMYIAILIRVLLSWIRLPRHNPFVTAILLLTDPILIPIKKMLDNSPLGGGMFDFSPILAIFFLNLARNLLLTLLISTL